MNTLNYEQGLLNNTINNVLTDADGFLWVATETGLQRYNGYSFESIDPIIEGKKININYSVFLYLLANNHIWISCKEGIIDFNPRTRLFEYCIKNKETQLQYNLLPFKETSTEIWYADKQNGISTWNKQTKKIESVFGKLEHDLLEKIFLREEVGGSNRLSVPTITSGAISYLASTNQILKINTDKRKYTILPQNFETIFSIEVLDNHLVTAHKNGVSCIDINTDTETKRILYTPFQQGAVTKANLQKCGDYILLSINNVLYELNTAFTDYKIWQTRNSTNILDVGFINTIYVDRFNRTWLITNNDLKRIQNTALPFQHFYNTATKNNFVKNIYYNDSKSQIIAGTYGGGLQVYDSIGNNLYTSPIANIGMADAMNIIPTNSNEYLITPFFKKWHLVDIENNRSTPVIIASITDTILGSQKVNFINNAIKTGPSEYMIATSKNIFKCVLVGNTITEALPVFNFLSGNDSYLCFLRTTKNTIWTGTRSGTILYKENNGTEHIIKNIGNHFIRSAAEDSTGNIWIGTDRGLHLFTATGTLIKSFYIQNGLKSDCIYAILPVANTACVFVSTNLGLSQITANGGIINYSKELGLQDNEFNTGSAFKNKEGKLFFGGINGITTFYPDKLNEIEANLQIHLSRFVINDSAYTYPSTIWKGDTILLKNYQNHLQFDIVANGVLNANEYNYQYRVLGFEQNWQSTNNPVNIRYTLQPGKYFLQITCTPLLSTGVKFTKTIFIYIQPAWYQKKWVQLLLLFTALTIVGLFVYQYQRITYLRKIKALQIQNEIQKDRERISRELHDNLGTQLSYISSNTDFMLDIDERLNIDERKKRLGKINNTAKESIADLRETIWALKKIDISLEELSDRIKAFTFNYKDVFQLHFTNSLIKNITLTSSESLNLFRLCQEAITNTAKYAKAANLYISITNNEQFLYKIELKDDGVGFNAQKIEGEHYGLENMKTRATEIKATLLIESTLNKGTCIIISK